MSLKEIIPQEQEKDPDYIVERKVLMEEVVHTMKQKLNEREYKIITLRYGLDGEIEHTQQEVADILNISRSYISRIETKAIDTINLMFKNKN